MAFLSRVGNGWIARRIAPGFDAEYYLAANPDVAASGRDPLLHFIRYGRAEGRPPGPAKAETDPVAEAFDAAFYLRSYPDVADAGVEPLAHFLSHGWREGRDPNPRFSTRFYLLANPDVAGAGENPFRHYLETGRAEGRLPRPPGGDRAAFLANMRSLEEVVDSTPVPAVPSLPVEAVSEVIRARLRAGSGQLVLSIGHDDYRGVSAGVQLCIAHEARQATARGIAYLNLHPLRPLPCFARPQEDLGLRLVLNGTEIGSGSLSQVSELIAGLVRNCAALDTVIHSLLGHSPEGIARLIRRVSGRSCLFWLHDFLSICPGYALLRNDLAFCGAPDSSASACLVCRYGAERASHRRRIARFFDEVIVRVAAPSDFARDLWLARGNLPDAGLEVVPLVHLRRGATSGARAAGCEVRIGYLGAATIQKGWPEFRDLAAEFARDGRYSFHQFGPETAEPGIRSHRVDVARGGHDGMVAALTREGIDLVLNWPAGPETFSFTAHEVLAAGAGLITNPWSGNVAALVGATGRGLVLEDVAGLRRLFAGGDLSDAATAARRHASRRPRFEMGDLSLPLLFGGATA
ncbi:MAG: hypothetical protein HUJ27_00950 [Rhodobacteraceae bacterium]|nr:hypothetical protein [Paracoccaceae bacterium]